MKMVVFLSQMTMTPMLASHHQVLAHILRGVAMPCPRPRWDHRAVSVLQLQHRPLCPGRGLSLAWSKGPPGTMTPSVGGATSLPE